MSRNFILAMGALLWMVVVLVAIGHVLAGDWLVPVGMASIAVVWVTLRRVRWARPQTA